MHDHPAFHWLAPAHAPCPPVFVGEDKPPFEGAFEFPGTRGKWKVNVPLKDGITDEYIRTIPTQEKRTSRRRRCADMNRLCATYRGPDLPWNEWFGPRYRLEVVASSMEDMNGSLEQVRINALEHLNSAPSIGMHDVPRESIWALGRRAIPRTNWMNG
ncbi:hypothetical protein EV421DRAFT_2024369 [Armillaria borealis]|uniref:Uncharacterized protein n=1 Tax=Armillaria borealis TaxID=47425 RepID=A0AA39IZF5_9AGAR|nr:hypothetical protein EV421DRAFT_2024369 [Armillaria borealis]